MDHVGHRAGGALGETGANLGSGRSTSDLIKSILANVQEIIRSEVRLAKAETWEQGEKAWAATRMLGAGAVLGLYALGFLLTAIALLLARVMQTWLAMGLTAVIVGAIAAVLLSAGRQRISQVHFKPQKTVDSVKENVEWMKSQTKS